VIAPGETMVYIGDEESLRRVAVETLTELAGSLREQAPEGSNIRYRTDTTGLEDINEIAMAEGAEIIVMGTTGKGKLEEMVAGSNAIRVCEVSDFPVVLVPSDIPMQPVASIIFACDLKEVQETIPEEKIFKVLDAFHVPLSVIHIGKGKEKESQDLLNDQSEETKQLHKLFQNYNPVYRDIHHEDIATGILEFAKHEPASMVLLVAKKHGFPGGLFHRSITKQLAFHTPVPLLVLREKEEEAVLYPEMPLLEI
jgi:nucleotide-binding universal stress UspA family protein